MSSGADTCTHAASINKGLCAGLRKGAGQCNHQNSDSRSAASYHVEYEGYDPGDAHAERIMRVPDDLLKGPLPRHAQIPDLKKLRFQIGSGVRYTRIVSLRDGSFMEGATEQMVRTADDNVSEAQGEGRPNQTRRPQVN